MACYLEKKPIFWESYTVRYYLDYLNCMKPFWALKYWAGKGMRNIRIPEGRHILQQIHVAKEVMEKEESWEWGEGAELGEGSRSRREQHTSEFQLSNIRT